MKTSVKAGLAVLAILIVCGIIGYIIFTHPGVL
jgi:hypothetical protein